MGKFDLKEQMTTGVKWAGAGQIANYILQFFVWATLARLLPPDNFGALGVAVAFSNAILIFNELGMSTALIQKKDVTGEHKLTTFWVSITVSLIFVILAVLCAPFIANFFQNQAITYLVVVLSFKVLIDSFGVVHESLLRKALFFKNLAFIEVISGLLFAAVSVSLAVKGFGIISIAYGYLTKSVLKVILLWRSCLFRPSLKFDKESFNDLFSFGKNIIGFKILNYLANSIDIILIGRLLGLTVLGYYSLALHLVNFPRQKLSSIISQVTFPAFSKLQDYFSDIRNAYLKVIRYTSIISFPLLTGLLVLSPQFVRIVFSPKWSGMIVPMQILCIYGLCFSVTTFAGVVFNSTGHPQYSFRLSILTLFGTAVAVLYGFNYGLIGIAAALSVYAITINLIGNLMVGNIVEMNMFSYYKAMIPAITSSGIMLLWLVVIVNLQRYLFGASEILFLIFAVLTGAIIYTAAFYFISYKTFKEMTDIFYKMFKS